MRVTVLQLPATWGASARMLERVDAELAAGPRSDLVVLPEASLNGYVSPRGDFDLTRYAEPLDGLTASRAAEIARSHATHLVAPLVLREEDAIYNAMIGFAPSGDVEFVYRKRHPWLPETWATPGPTAPPLVEIGGRLVTIAVCYDVHFLARDATRELEAADLLLFPSAWVEEVDHRVAHLATLARRFELHVANANWAPGAVVVPGQGGSCIVRPDGSTIVIGTDTGTDTARLDFVLP